MSETVIVAVIASIGSLLVAWVTAQVALYRSRSDGRLVRIRDLEARITQVENELARERVERRTLEDYAETLRDHIVKHLPPPPPPWPIPAR